MRSVRIFLAHWYVLGAGLGLSLTAAGCGGDSGKTEMIKPAVSPQEAGKDSMDYYKEQMKKSGAKK